MAVMFLPRQLSTIEIHYAPGGCGLVVLVQESKLAGAIMSHFPGCQEHSLVEVAENFVDHVDRSETTVQKKQPIYQSNDATLEIVLFHFR